MKITQVSENIWSLRTWAIIPIHVWVVTEEDGLTLVDAGIPTMGKGIRKFLKQLKAGPLKRILLTHGHSDHVGALNKVLQEQPVPVYAHRMEIPYMEGEITYPGRKKPAQSIEKHLAQPLKEDENGNLLRMGALTPYITPGHSPGHVVYYHEKDQVLLAGDLFTSKNGKLHRPIPMFTADMEKAIRSSEVVRQLKPKRLEVCHGNPVLHPVEDLDNYIDRTLTKQKVLKS
ncbi:MBL fold metallo-hydrolase [Thalassobacillus pellis]|uniref:MBL fold metallo-hydrolase n=1 Tax=Thalassobacillus pellis TaxID=748008 RepID=UPI0019614F5C|nr:MBL fold metallo-hydrolase [Thalassobacillus pellis]MBM7551246.1 glyoxylase-like metal-dependent hydrolase (beta-lactamase superfamily II) [Thalassobacillus pellis]